ncbi:formylglycine-generating enzyme family protein [uncultured Thiodictyon sp.]|uniref:formylglycine-generating enzyme family protein n=1 Tax=uncultured Thiodictyon sp. TaxID=1846217 RepID=UPI0025EF25FC|nr:formylglycine-generating enzyme family protein [uncultured Thiodictyon sp.]
MKPLRIHSPATAVALLFAALAAHPVWGDAQGPIPQTIALPAGDFQMGCLAGDPVCHDNEQPVHTVSLPAFAIGKTEVTFAQWDACVAAGGCAHAPNDAGWGRGKRPVVDVSWDDIQQYLAWLNQQTGAHYRLPSEAEWEYAARAGTTTAFSTGNCLTTDQANYSDSTDYPGCGAKSGVSLGKSQPVASYPANPWGLFDLHGNVWEWVQDCWHDSYTDAPADGAVWSSACTDSQQRGIRGGSLDSDPHFLRAAFRLRGLTDLRNASIGFRVARTLAPPRDIGQAQQPR